MPGSENAIWRGSESNRDFSRGYMAILRARPYPYHHSYHFVNMLMCPDRDSTLSYGQKLTFGNFGERPPAEHQG